MREAIETLRQASARIGPDVEVEIRLGKDLAETGSVAEAIPMLERTTRAVPDDAEAANGRDRVRARRTRPGRDRDLRADPGERPSQRTRDWPTSAPCTCSSRTSKRPATPSHAPSRWRRPHPARMPGSALSPAPPDAPTRPSATGSGPSSGTTGISTRCRPGSRPGCQRAHGRGPSHRSALRLDGAAEPLRPGDRGFPGLARGRDTAGQRAPARPCRGRIAP